MVIFITGASHTGKTNLAQKLLEKYHYPYLSLDHLKMGLIRSGRTNLTPMSNLDDLTEYLWPTVVEIAKTVIENKQNLIIEGCYIPFDWKNYFTEEYIKDIRCYCLVMSEDYIREHYSDIACYANVIEHRLDDNCSAECLIAENQRYLALAQQNHIDYLLIDGAYTLNIDL
jgi:hypothetical protein